MSHRPKNTDVSAIEERLAELYRKTTGSHLSSLTEERVMRAAYAMALENAAAVAEAYAEISSTVEDRTSYERPRSVRANIAQNIRPRARAR